MILAFSPVVSAVNTAAKVNFNKTCEQLDELAYSGNDLGAVYSKENTGFKLWAPTAERVKLKLYSTGSDDEEGAELLAEHEMDYNCSNGIWSLTVRGNLHGTYYIYEVTVDGKTQQTADPYAKAAGVNGNRSMVVDLSLTDPQGWKDDSFTRVDKQTDALIWEVHIKDFSASESSGVSEKNRGKYLAFTETGTTLNGEGTIKTCVAYLKDLGINYVQINPFFDFGSVDEGGDNSQYNWGYDPVNYNVPEGSYSSNPYDGSVRIKEAKEMIKALHDNGIGVVMDVVYNHVYDAEFSCFENTVPGYYFRHDKDGKLADGSGCGNDTASERAMYRKYMVDSIIYWAQEYHIDGFRFDLMGLHDIYTMNLIRQQLNTLPDGKKILMYGEAWKLNTVSDAELAIQVNMFKLDLNIAAFNDGIRDAVKGDNFIPSEGGFVQGVLSSADVKDGIMAATMQWSQQPSQTVSYVSCHDNMTLYDKLVATTLGQGADYRARNEELVRMNKLAAVAYLTAQGIPFMLAGEEMARSKDGDHNSFKSDVELNQIDWSSLTRYSDLVKYYKGLIDIRKAYSPMRCEDKTVIGNMIFYNECSENVLGYMYQNATTDGEWDKLVCILNGGKTDQEVKLEGKDIPKSWVAIANGESAGVEKLAAFNSDSVTIKAGQALILVDEQSFNAAAVKAEKTSIDSLPDIVLASSTATKLAAEIDKKDSPVKKSLPYILGGIGLAALGAGVALIIKRRRKNRGDKHTR